MIKKIIEETSVKIDTEQDAYVHISSPNNEMNAKAKAMIENIVREAKVGEYYMAKVNALRNSVHSLNYSQVKTDCSTFLEISEERTKVVEDVLKMGDECS